MGKERIGGILKEKKFIFPEGIEARKGAGRDERGRWGPSSKKLGGKKFWPEISGKAASLQEKKNGRRKTGEGRTPPGKETPWQRGLVFGGGVRKVEGGESTGDWSQGYPVG